MSRDINHRFIRACALVFGSIALLAGLFVGYEFRHQTTHAMPWAIWTAAVVSSLPAALCAALCARTFHHQRRITVAAAGALFVGATATLSAAMLYAILSALAFASDGDWVAIVRDQASQIPDYMLMYLVASALVWVWALPMGTFALRRMCRCGTALRLDQDRTTAHSSERLGQS